MSNKQTTKTKARKQASKPAAGWAEALSHTDWLEAVRCRSFFDHHHRGRWARDSLAVVVTLAVEPVVLGWLACFGDAGTSSCGLAHFASSSRTSAFSLPTEHLCDNVCPMTRPLQSWRWWKPRRGRTLGILTASTFRNLKANVDTCIHTWIAW